MTILFVVGLVLVLGVMMMRISNEVNTGVNSTRRGVTIPGARMVLALRKCYAKNGITSYLELTEKQLTDAIGAPQAKSMMANGRRLLQWQATGYHVAFIFFGDTCEGMTSEYHDAALNYLFK
jgi:hypothetical protein